MKRARTLSQKHQISLTERLLPQVAGTRKLFRKLGLMPTDLTVPLLQVLRHGPIVPSFPNKPENAVHAEVVVKR